MTTERTSPTASATSMLTLPALPNLDYLKKQAKHLLRDFRARQSDALQTIASFHPRADEFTHLRDAQLTLARQHGFADWDQLVMEVELRQLRHGSLKDQAERFISHACLRYNGDDQAWRYRRASEWLRQLPELTRDFHCALVAADLDAVRAFLQRDASLATRSGGPANWPPLMYVTYSRVEQNQQHAVAVARLLMEYGADPDIEGPVPGGGFNAVTGAIGEGERGPISCVPHPSAEELVKLFFDAGANPNQSQGLYNTMFQHNLGKWLRLMVQYGLKAGDPANWNPNNKEPIFDFLLNQVVMQGKLDVVRFLLEHGADANAINRYNHRSAHANAVLGAHADIAELLVQYGAKPQPLTLDDRLRLACGKHDYAQAGELLTLNPHLLLDNQLFRDCAMVDIDTCLWLVQQGYDINTRNRDGQTTLHNYALWNDADAVRTLLAHGADPDLKEYHYQATALGLALHHRHWPVIDALAPISNDIFDVCRTADHKRLALLLARDPSLAQQRTPMGNTPLHTVSQTRQEAPDYDASVATMELLLQHGVDANARNKDGFNAAAWYRRHGMDELAEWLEPSTATG